MNAAQAIAQNYPPEYRISDWPFTFYFNGEALPKWSACWPGTLVHKYARKTWGNDVDDRDVWIISTKIDHCGIIESAPAATFLFAAQQMLVWLLEHGEEAIPGFRLFEGSPNPAEVMNGVVEGCFQMRELVLRDRFAAWTSGLESDREGLTQVIDQLRTIPVPTLLPPHQQSVSFMVASKIREQVKHFHRLAQGGRFDKSMRRRLSQLTMPDESFLKLVT